MRRGVTLAALAVALVACAGRPPTARARAGDIEIRDGFAYEPITPASGAAYFRIRNTGAAPDTLLEVTSPAARDASFHGNAMQHLAVLAVPPGAEVTLAPGGTHLMLSDYSTVPAAGDSLTVTLRFARAGSVTLKLPVRRYGE
jgi:copper(I)-binding protein